MSCVDRTTWNKAVADCQNLQASVKGFGYVPAGMRGLGAAAFLANSSLITTAAQLNTTPPAVTYDPCAIAQQTPCAQAAPRALLSTGPVLAKLPEIPLMSSTPAPPVKTAGFSQWGLLAALAVGGVVVYAVTHKKKSSS